MNTASGIGEHTIEGKPYASLLQDALKKRKVRGPAYLKALAEIADNHYRFCQGTSPMAQRSAVQHSRKILRSGDLEKILALVDMRIPAAYLTMLGCSEESVLAEVMYFFEDTEYAFVAP